MSRGAGPSPRAWGARLAAGGRVVGGGSAAVTGVGRAAVVALASLGGATLPVEMPGAGNRGRGVVVPPVRAHDGVVPVPLTESGLGHGVDRTVLAGHTSRRLVVDSRGAHTVTEQR